MEINIEDYLSESEIKTICESEIRRQVAAQFGQENETNIMRMVSNLSYYHVHQAVDAKMGGELDKVLTERVTALIKDKDYSHVVFRAANAWDRKESHAYTILRQCLENHRELMTSKMKAAIEGLNPKDFKNWMITYATGKF